MKNPKKTSTVPAKKIASTTRTGGDTCPRIAKDYPWQMLGLLLKEFENRRLVSPDNAELVRKIIRGRSYTKYAELGEHWGLQSWNLEATGYSCEREVLYQLSQLLSKYSNEDKSSLKRREDAALQKFYKSEELCRSAARRLRVWKNDPELSAVIPRLRKIIRGLVGVKPPPIELLINDMRHGPGSSLQTVNGEVCSYFKYLHYPYTVSRGASATAKTVIMADSLWVDALTDKIRRDANAPAWALLDMEQFKSFMIEETDNAKVCFVPKNASSERIIAIEPTMNTYMTLGIDGFIRRRLLQRWGMDLNSQRENQMLACLGSFQDADCKVSTLDLSMASDLVSSRLVKEIFPPEWWKFLYSLRSKRVVLPNRHGSKVVPLWKISSMGNGYTFALESLIFLAVLRSVASEESPLSLRQLNKLSLKAYGDDLIMPDSLAGRTIEVLEMLGFRVNRDKSFTNGLCRESCGTDWVSGHAVRPVFIRKPPSKMSQLIGDRNRLGRWLETRMGIPLEDSLTIKEIDSRYKLRSPYVPTGPLSDEEFDSWIHTRHWSSEHRDPDHPWVFRWRAIVQSVVAQSDDKEFWFRLLMRRTPKLAQQVRQRISSGWLPEGCVEAANTFIVFRRNVLRCRVAIRCSSLWSDEYRFVLPPSPLGVWCTTENHEDPEA